MSQTDAAAILDFWFREVTSEQWWKADASFDQQVGARFLNILEQAARGELAAWRETPHGRLAEIIVLDQFSRNVWRGTAQAFTQDAMALALSQEAVRAGALSALTPVECAFLLMPWMHSESNVIHVQAEVLFREHAPTGSYDFELKHKAIIDRFGRYPHRNATLGRPSTEEELAFLQQPGSSF